MKKEILKAIYDDDLVNILSKIGEFSDVKAGKRKCKLCHTVITFDNISCIYPESGSVKYICSNQICISDYCKD